MTMNTNISGVPSTISLDDLLDRVGANRTPARVQFKGDIYDGTKAHANDPQKAIEGMTDAILSDFDFVEKTEIYKGYTMPEIEIALNSVLRRIPGGVSQTIARNPTEQPGTKRVEAGYDWETGQMNYVVVADGAASLPSFRGMGKRKPWIEAVNSPNGPVIRAEVLRGDQDLLEGLFGFVRDWADQNTIYRGQVIDTSFNFIKLTDFNPENVALDDDLRRAFEQYVLGPLRYPEALAQKRQPPKTGLFLWGPPGGGKSMTVALAEYTAARMGAVVVHVDPQLGIRGLQRADQMTVRLMKAGHKAMICMEDMEKLADESREAVLEILDGVSSKGLCRTVIGTTNFLEQIDRAMLRPGRFDSIRYCGLPDRSAFEQLVRIIIPSEDLADDIDFDVAFPAFEGYSYAFIANAVGVIYRSAINRLKGDLEGFTITTQDLVDAANDVRGHFDLMSQEVKKEGPVLDQLFRTLVNEGVEEVVSYAIDNRMFSTHDSTDYDTISELISEQVDMVVESRLDGARIEDKTLRTN